MLLRALIKKLTFFADEECWPELNVEATVAEDVTGKRIETLWLIGKDGDEYGEIDIS